MVLDDQELRELIRINFEYSYLHDDWVFPLEDALEGLTAEQAAWRPPSEEAMGIWDIVLHLATWNRNIIERIETGENAHPTGGAWPARPEELGEREWDGAKAELWDSIAALKGLIESGAMEKIKESPYGFADLLCRFTHMAYHSGQIVKIRECQGW